MSFSAPGEKPPLFIEQTLANLFSAILRRVGDDSFLEQTLKELLDMVSPIFARKVFGPEGTPTQARSEYTIQEQGRFSVPSITNVPQDAIDNLEEIKELLIPFYPPELVQKRLDELITSYHQTGDSTIFKRALVYYLNRSPY